MEDSELEKMVKDLMAALEKSNKELEHKTIQVDNQQDQINTLNSIVTEYKQYKDINKELEFKINELNTKITDVLHSNADLESKIINSENMKEFYKGEVVSLKAEIKELNNSIKEIDKKHQIEIKNIEGSHKDEVKAIENGY